MHEANTDKAELFITIAHAIKKRVITTEYGVT